MFFAVSEYIMDSFQSTVKMSPHLLAFIVSDYDYTENEFETNFRIWHDKAKKDQAKLAADNLPKIVHFYEDYFGISYPLPKMDMAAIPDPFGAMENWGLITFGEKYLLFDEENSGAMQKQSIITVMAHEIVHQWFGDLVTMKWWTDFWLSEGITSESLF